MSGAYRDWSIITEMLDRQFISRYWIKSCFSESQGEGPYFTRAEAEQALKGREDNFYIVYTDE